MAINMISAFLISLLSGLGIGGGGLFTVYLALVSDIPQLAAQGLNLLFFLFSSGASVTVQIFRRKIMFTAVGIMIASGIVGVFIGTMLSGWINGEYLRRIFGVMLISGGIISLRQSLSKKSSTSDAQTREKNTLNDQKRAK
ncbi:MAG: sulfite exporter TauE/SafE family protein [Ruminococcaceae bacterium]|nr:sulfite exporter TauE/SafE family protein [Oscillospiraceae bacterium]